MNWLRHVSQHDARRAHTRRSESRRKTAELEVEDERGVRLLHLGLRGPGSANITFPDTKYRNHHPMIPRKHEPPHVTAAPTTANSSSGT